MSNQKYSENMVELIKFIDDTFEKLSKQVPGFIFVSLVRAEEGSLMAAYPREKKRELELITPFHLQIFNNAIKSLEAGGNTSGGVHEIIIKTPDRLFMMASKSQKVVGIIAVEASKANLGLTRKLAEKTTDDIFDFLRRANLNL